MQVIKAFLQSALLTGVLINPVSCQKSSKTPKSPNIIVMLADDLGYSDLGCFDSQHILTPVLDSIAKEGIRLTNFYAGSVVCSPSRAALLTGKNHNRIGVYSWIPEESPMHLKVEEKTIAAVLKESGYQTSHFGKWHLGRWNDTEKKSILPSITEYGFDYWYACANNALPTHQNPDNFYLNNKPLGKQEGFSCQLLADQALHWLEHYRKPTKPFYMQLWFNEPHEKVSAPDRFKQRHLDNGLTEHQADYYGCIENMDHAIGRVLLKLKELGVSKETLVIFTSDNGSKFPGSNGILKGQKGQVWEGGIRVPAIFYWEDRIIPKRDQNMPCGVIDLFPTICELTHNKAASSSTTDGVSLMPLIKNYNFVREKPLYTFHHHGAAASLRQGDMCLIGFLDEKSPGTNKFRKEHYIYMQRANLKTFELYNLKNDPSQTNDISKNYPEIIDEMKLSMINLYNETISEGMNWFK